MSSNSRWYSDPARGDIATIRRRADAQQYHSPEIVEQALMGEDFEDLTIQPPADENTCPTCGQYVDACSGCGKTIAEHEDE